MSWARKIIREWVLAQDLGALKAPLLPLDTPTVSDLERIRVEYFFREPRPDNRSRWVDAEAGDGGIVRTLLFLNAEPMVLESLEGIGRALVVRVQGEEQLTARFPHATIGRNVLPLVLLPEIPNGKSRLS